MHDPSRHAEGRIATPTGHSVGSIVVAAEASIAVHHQRPGVLGRRGRDRFGRARRRMAVAHLVSQCGGSQQLWPLLLFERGGAVVRMLERGLDAAFGSVWAILLPFALPG